MNNNEFLKAMHERMPGAWLRQLFVHDEWFDLNGDLIWYDGLQYRLIPAVPDGCKPPPEESYAYGPDRPGAVCIDGPVKLPDGVKYVPGWCWQSTGCWSREFPWTGNDETTAYLLDLTDPNAAAILALNRPDWKMPETKPEMPEGVPPLPDGWEYVGMGDAISLWEESLFYTPGLSQRWEITFSSQLSNTHYARRKQTTPEQRAAMDELTAEGQERGEYDLDEPVDVDVLAIPADVVDGSDIQSVLIEAMACGYSLKMIGGAIVGWRDD